MKVIAFCVLNADYIDPAIVALRSFFEWNSTIQVQCYLEQGRDYSRLKEALKSCKVNFKEVEFPKEDIFNYAGGDYLLVPKTAMPSISERLVALDELKADYDLIINFDLDTLFCNSISKVIATADSEHVYGVDEKPNRTKWLQELKLTEWINSSKYFNTGFVVYGANVLRKFNIYDSFLEALKEEPTRFNCPEQDWLNYLMHEYLITIKPCFNLMFTDAHYFAIAPVMVHFFGSLKPWNDEEHYFGNASFYFDKYRKVAEQYSRWLSADFLKKLK